MQSCVTLVIYRGLTAPRKINFIMLQQQFSGAVMVNGGERRLLINGNPLGRTVIQVDGVTAYDKKPFVHKETIDFEIIPGKKAILRWQQVSLKGMEVDISVDGRTTTLPAVSPAGLPGRPVSPRQREDFKVRAIGAGLIALSAVSLFINYGEVQSGRHYTKYLFISPLLVVNGLIFLVHPRMDLSMPATKRGFIALQFALLIFGWFFTKWFLGAFVLQ